MAGDDYLDGLPPEQAAGLTQVNEPGLTALRGYLASGRAETLRALASQSPEEVVEIIGRTDGLVLSGPGPNGYPGARRAGTPPSRSSPPGAAPWPSANADLAGQRRSPGCAPASVSVAARSSAAATSAAA